MKQPLVFEGVLHGFCASNSSIRKDKVDKCTSDDEIWHLSACSCRTERASGKKFTDRARVLWFFFGGEGLLMEEILHQLIW